MRLGRLFLFMTVDLLAKPAIYCLMDQGEKNFGCT